MLRRIQGMVANTWSAIAHDVLDLSPRLSSSDAAEVTIDADYPLMYGGDKEAAKVLNSLPYEQALSIARNVIRRS